MTSWDRKLDARTRSTLETDEADGPWELLVGLAAPVTPDQLRELEAAGLVPYSRSGTVIGGRVGDLAALRRVLDAGFVRHIELARPLHQE